jgi:hypothetical protein
MTGMIVPDQSLLSGSVTERRGIAMWKALGTEQLRKMQTGPSGRSQFSTSPEI